MQRDSKSLAFKKRSQALLFKRFISLETYKVCYRDYKNKKVHLVGILRTLIEKLKELEELRKAEVITEEEYQKLKEKLLPDNEAIRHEK